MSIFSHISYIQYIMTAVKAIFHIFEKRVKSAIMPDRSKIFFTFRRFNRHMEILKLMKFQRSATNIPDLVII